MFAFMQLEEEHPFAKKVKGTVTTLYLVTLSLNYSLINIVYK